MEFKKVTISLPKNLYEEGMGLVNKGLFSNFSDLVRSGIREEFKGLQPVIQDFDERLIYNDKELISGVKQSMKEVKSGKGKILKSEKDMDKYMADL
ncbi:MAG: ribbon-helix-helix domain-containing protein [Nanoarchaeota archaeon]|nr:ribbon-helix-helix domain-containing protein [Nanoarchaeota archaeon]MBU1321295.1 ribbon-helix-helix domain-containing protein [Nanoarchaeota archaeon]MBU1597464.1 ribbon-helix-helix domain-containing protein [Nanoarchaeota archaeon]MBU2441467.1 ribbon-helix-helix domain-containing protein [Nanoarchaeota archaeon]